MGIGNMYASVHLSFATYVYVCRSAMGMYVCLSVVMSVCLSARIHMYIGA